MTPAELEATFGTAMVPQAKPMLDNIRQLYSRLAVLTAKQERAMDSGDQFKIFKYDKERQRIWDDLIDQGWALVLALHLEADVQASERSVLEFLEEKFTLV